MSYTTIVEPDPYEQLCWTSRVLYKMFRCNFGGYEWDPVTRMEYVKQFMR